MEKEKIRTWVVRCHCMRLVGQKNWMWMGTLIKWYGDYLLWTSSIYPHPWLITHKRAMIAPVPSALPPSILSSHTVDVWSVPDQTVEGQNCPRVKKSRGCGICDPAGPGAIETKGSPSKVPGAPFQKASSVFLQRPEATLNITLLTELHHPQSLILKLMLSLSSH